MIHDHMFFNSLRLGETIMQVQGPVKGNCKFKGCGRETILQVWGLLVHYYLFLIKQLLLNKPSPVWLRVYMIYVHTI